MYFAYCLAFYHGSPDSQPGSSSQLTLKPRDRDQPSPWLVGRHPASQISQGPRFCSATRLRTDRSHSSPPSFLPQPGTRRCCISTIAVACSRSWPGACFLLFFFLVALSPGRLPPANLLIYSWLRVVLCRPDTDLLSSPRAFAPNNATRASCLPRPLPLDRHNNIPSHPHTSASSPHTPTTLHPPHPSRRVASLSSAHLAPRRIKPIAGRRCCIAFFFFFPLPIEHCPRIASLSRDRRRHVLVGHAAECHRPLGQGMALGQPGAQGLQGPDSAAQPAGQRGCHHRPQ